MVEEKSERVGSFDVIKVFTLRRLIWTELHHRKFCFSSFSRLDERPKIVEPVIVKNVYIFNVWFGSRYPALSRVHTPTCRVVVVSYRHARICLASQLQLPPVCCRRCVPSHIFMSCIRSQKHDSEALSDPIFVP